MTLSFNPQGQTIFRLTLARDVMLLIVHMSLPTAVVILLVEPGVSCPR